MAQLKRPSNPGPVAARMLTGLMVGWANFYLMMLFHEAGHLLGALATGAHIDRLDLSPIGLSHTNVSQNQIPLLVVWAGPIVDVALPLLDWLLIRMMKGVEEARNVREPAAFLDGFCLIANGVYIGLGWIDRVGDTGEMMRLGTPVLVMIGFGAAYVGAGLTMWHSLGPWLGLKYMTAGSAYKLLAVASAVVGVGFIAALFLA